MREEKKHLGVRNINKLRSSYKQRRNSEVKGKIILNDIVEYVSSYNKSQYPNPTQRNSPVPSLSLSDGYAHFGMLLSMLEQSLLTLKSDLCSQNSPHHLVKCHGLQLGLNKHHMWSQCGVPTQDLCLGSRAQQSK